MAEIIKGFLIQADFLMSEIKMGNEIKSPGNSKYMLIARKVFNPEKSA